MLIFGFGPGPDLPRARPGETTVLLSILSAAPLPSVQTTPYPHRTQNPAGGARVSSPEGMTLDPQVDLVILQDMPEKLHTHFL